MHLDMDLEEYKEYMDMLRKEMNQPYDYIVASYIKHALSLDVKWEITIKLGQFAL